MRQFETKEAATILSRFKGLYPEKRFPAPEDSTATDDEDMRGAGLSRAKTAAIKDLAQKVQDYCRPLPLESDRYGDRGR